MRLQDLLEAWATQVAARFNAPVYLVGSALRCEDDTVPRDIDVAVMLTNEQWDARYGIGYREHQLIGNTPSANVRKYWQDVAKLSGWCSRHHRLNIDLKIQNETDVREYGYDTHPRQRLDALDVPTVEDESSVTYSGQSELLGRT